MVSADSLLTRSLRLAPQGQAVCRILAAALNAVEPASAVRRHVHLDGDQLTVGDRTYDLTVFQHVRMLGIGKAAAAMCTALQDLLGDRLDSGLLVTKQVPPGLRCPFPILPGGHPVPDERSLAAGAKIVEFAATLGRGDLLFCLISGGGSALAASPIPGVTLTDLQALTAVLLECGASIEEINRLRRRLDRIKGGGLVRLANGAGIISLILSDVIGNPLEAVASGPTAPDPTTRQEALEVLDRYSLKEKISPSVWDALRDGPETPKPGDPFFLNVQNVIVGSNLQAAQAAMEQAALEGMHPYLLRTDLQGEARQAAFELATLLRQARQRGEPVPPPGCLIAGGETTVTLRGDGKGGRNTELALAAVTELANYPGVMLVTLATDGEDGPTDAAGAVVTGETYGRARELNLRPGKHLDRNDSYTFFAALDDLLKPGPTGTNVGDLNLLLTW